MIFRGRQTDQQHIVRSFPSRRNIVPSLQIPRDTIDTVKRALLHLKSGRVSCPYRPAYWAFAKPIRSATAYGYTYIGIHPEYWDPFSNSLQNRRNYERDILTDRIYWKSSYIIPLSICLRLTQNNLPYLVNVMSWRYEKCWFRQDP
jgi:hypothetical protein